MRFLDLFFEIFNIRDTPEVLIRRNFGYIVTLLLWHYKRKGVSKPAQSLFLVTKLVKSAKLFMQATLSIDVFAYSGWIPCLDTPELLILLF